MKFGGDRPFAFPERVEIGANRPFAFVEETRGANYFRALQAASEVFTLEHHLGTHFGEKPARAPCERSTKQSRAQNT